MDRRQHQQQWGVRNPYLQPSTAAQSPQNSTQQRNSLPEIYPNPDVLGLESVLSNLRVSSDYGLRRYRHLTAAPSAGPTAWGGGDDVASGLLRSDPPVSGYRVMTSGDVDVQGLMMRRNVGAGDFLTYGGLHHHNNLNVGPARSLTAPAGTDPRNLAASSAHPRLWYGGGAAGDSLRSRNAEIFYNDNNAPDPFLLCKKPLNQNANLYQNSQFPNLPSLNQNANSTFMNTLPSNLNKKDEIQQGKQQFLTLNLDELRGKIVSLAKDQNGCRILQDNLIFLDNEGTEVVLSEIIEYVGDLMKNQSGSYLIQKLFSVCSEEQRTNIILAVTKKPFQLVAICLNPFGARAMQKLLEDLSSPQQRSLVIAALCPGAVTLASDPNGHLVILYCLKNFSFEYNKVFLLAFHRILNRIDPTSYEKDVLELLKHVKAVKKLQHLINEIAKNCFGIATNRNGCCVLQSCIENAHGEARESLVNEIIANAVQLSENPYGNYVVQHLLGQNIPAVEDNLLERLEGKFASLACNKYASNVVEKFFVKPGEQSAKIIKELISSPNLSMLLVDPFGNYVIQKALKVAKGDVFNALIDLIMVNAPSMQSNIYGKMILACLSRGSRDVHSK